MQSSSKKLLSPLLSLLFVWSTETQPGGELLSLYCPFTPCCPPLWAGASQAQGFHPDATVPYEVTPPPRACALQARTLPKLLSLGAHSYSPGDPSSSPDAACTHTQLAGGHRGLWGAASCCSILPAAAQAPQCHQLALLFPALLPLLIHIKFLAEEAASAAVWIMR